MKIFYATLIGLLVSCASYGSGFLGGITGTTSLCLGGTSTLSDTTLGGIWSSSDNTIASVDSISGVVTGNGAGTAVISYSASGAVTTTTFTVNPNPSAIIGPATICVGDSVTFTDSSLGGSWSASFDGLGFVPFSGVYASAYDGVATILYMLPTGCQTSIPVTINPGPDPIVAGTTTACVGVGVTLSDATSGGVWEAGASSAVVVTGVGTGGGYVGMTAGTGTISYTLPSGCAATLDVTILPVPVVSITTIPSCGTLVELMASGAMSYSWSPTTGLSCGACATTYADPSVVATYSLIGTNAAGCTDTTSITLNNNRINGHISFSGTAPDTTDCKVWLIQFNPADSTIAALDSMTTCSDAGVPYFEFDSKPAGNYMVKAKLLSGSAPGTSGYIPTYSAASPYWDMAATAAHASATDVLDINMQYGTVPSGPGFIAGSVLSGAGKHTSTDAPAVNMLVYLQNASSGILTYTYTDAAGLYSFSGLAYGTYYIYPTDYDYYTTPSAAITLASGSDSMLSVNFKQHTTFGTITPYSGPTLVAGGIADHFSIYPNPAGSTITLQWNNLELGSADVSLTDMLGRAVYTSTLDVKTTTGNKVLDISNLSNGVYFVAVRSGSSVFSEKIVVNK